MTDHNCDVIDCSESAYISGPGIWLCRTHYDELHAWNAALGRQATEQLGGPTPQTCPRRMDDFGPWEREENLDEWHIRGPKGAGMGDGEFTCSFCGSLHPDTFMQWVRDGYVVGPTDKSYKAYIGRERERTQYDPSEFPAGGQDAKFYFQHLSAEQRRELIALCNAQSVKFGYPGHFYRLPFFMVRAT